MRRLKGLLIIIMIFLFVSCEKKVSEVEFEKNVLTEIFPSLIDSTCFDVRVFRNFPPKYGEIIYDKKGNYIRIDTTKATIEQKIQLLKWKKRTLEIEKDTSKIVIAFDPKIKKNKRKNLKEDFEKHFVGSKLYNSKIEDSLEYFLDLGDIKLNNKFKLKNLSDFPKERDSIWQAKYDFNFSGIVYFSRIEFDKQKRFGILDGGFVCGRHFGQGFRIYIKKVESKWIIDKVEGTWIS